MNLDTDTFDYTRYVLKISRAFISSLDSREKYWCMRTIANLIVKDGKVTEEEIIYMEEMFKLVKLEKHQLHDVRAILLSGQAVDLEPLPNFSKEKVLTTLRVLMLIAISDMEFHPKEKEFIRQAGACIGCPIEDIERLISEGEREIERVASPTPMRLKSRWNDQEAMAFAQDTLAMRVYTSRLLGQEPSLVLHGGGNTSVKAHASNLLGEAEKVLYVKGSGWDLATIEAGGFAPVKLDALKKMAELPHLSDADMVRLQRAAMTDPNAPNPSVEAILHAIIPYKYVDHTHADVLIALTNTENSEALIRQLYGERLLIIPYVMPGFLLAKKVYEMTRKVDWSRHEGMVLMNHGLFSFANDARTSYERMIYLVNVAEDYLKKHGGRAAQVKVSESFPLEKLASFRREASRLRGQAMIVLSDQSPEAAGFANLPKVASIATRGPLTPDHVIRTKRLPLVTGGEPLADLSAYAAEYRQYFERHTTGKLTCLDPSPRWAVWPGLGLLSLGTSVQEARITQDITHHTIRAIQWAESLGGWKALSEREIFEVEYWDLEQAKLRKNSASLPFQGKVAIVTGAASGIGQACAKLLQTQGAAVVALDLNPEVLSLFQRPDLVGQICDVTDSEALKEAVESTIRRFGGLDLLISNAGNFPPSRQLAEMDQETWNRSLQLNLTSHQRLLQYSAPYLAQGIDPAVVFIASKNVPAPGPGAGAYSVAKAGLTQLARVAALEMAGQGIRVNVIHPNGVFDTGIWTPEVLETRAKHYGMSVEQYKTNNLLQVEVTSQDVAALACAMLGPLFSKVTGAQIPLDGGNDRVI